jgi:DnaJ-related protein SCJ1
MQISLKESLLGFKKIIKHLDGHEVLIEQKGVTQPNYTKIIMGEGMPLREDSSEFGELHIKFLVRLPTKILPNQQEILKQIFDL